jgi:transcriptional regulator with XRE-family HTH domain
MSDRAHRAGKSISHSQLADYAAGHVRKAPDVEQMEALAAALGVGFESVRAAVFEQYYGYVPRELQRTAKLGRVVAAIPADLDPDQEEELLRMIEAWLSVRRNP